MRSFLAEVGKHFAVTAVYFAILTLAYSVFNGWSRQVIFLWAGALAGAELPDLDHIAYAFLTYREAPTSREVRKLAGENRLGEALSSIAEHHKDFEPVHLITHNCFMQAAFYAFAFCMVLSSGNLFWTGLAMSVLLHLLKDEWEDLRVLPGRLRSYLFRHFHRTPPLLVKAYVVTATALFVLLSVLIVFPVVSRG
ncbi:MAG: hypothetical protein P9M00_01800 [Candidatus Tritonobacter lacicola]|nr:hypothetical protein [Candidatus Tritonobacter lacicola]